MIAAAGVLAAGGIHYGGWEQLFNEVFSASLARRIGSWFG